MIHFYRSRRAPTVLVATIVSLLLLVVLGDLLLTLPSLFGGAGSEVPLGTLLPLVIATALSYGLSARERTVEDATVRRRVLYDLLIIFVVVVLSAVATGAASIRVGSFDLALWYMRNLLLMSGIVLFFVGVRKPLLGGTACVLLVVVTTAYGPSNRGARFVRVFQNESVDAWSWLVALTGLLGGLLVTLCSDWLRRHGARPAREIVGSAPARL